MSVNNKLINVVGPIYSKITTGTAYPRFFVLWSLYIQVAEINAQDNYYDILMILVS